MSSTYRVGVVFEGLGHSSFGLVSRALPEAVLFEAGEVTTVRATVRAPGPAAAVSQLVENVTKAVPAAVPLRVDQDLVSVSDIAHRVGRTRESVRLLVDGKRGPGRFPPPIGVVGDGTRVWPWSVVLEWFDKVLGVDLGEDAVPPPYWTSASPPAGHPGWPRPWGVAGSASKPRRSPHVLETRRQLRHRHPGPCL